MISTQIKSVDKMKSYLQALRPESGNEATQCTVLLRFCECVAALCLSAHVFKFLVLFCGHSYWL